MAFQSRLVSERNQSKYFIDFETKDLLRATAEERFNVYDVAIRNSVMNPNECRKAENLPARAGGDEYSQSWIQKVRLSLRGMIHDGISRYHHPRFAFTCLKKNKVFPPRAKCILFHTGIKWFIIQLIIKGNNNMNLAVLNAVTVELTVDWHQYGASSFALNGATILAANGTTPFAPNRST